MHSVMISKSDAERLGLNEQSMEKRLEQVNKRLTRPVLEVLSPAIETHVMMYGTNFSNGVELLTWVSDVTRYAIAGLMEQGKVAKKLPGVKAEPPMPGQYL